MNKRLWAALIAAAVTLTSTAVVPCNYEKIVTSAAQKKPNGSAEVADTSTDGRTTAGGFTFSINGTEAMITGYSGTATELNIPTKITVTKPNSSSSNSGGSIKAPADSANSTDYNVTSIGSNAFSGHLGIKTVTMSGGTDKDGKLFGLRTIGERAFFACQDLATITIASTTTSIGNFAFADCVALNSIKVADGNQRYKIIDGALYYYTAGTGTGAYSLEQYPIGNTAKEYKVPDTLATTLTEIGEGAFWGSQNLESISLTSTVKKIGERAFAECRKLTSISMPSGVTSIGVEAFKGDHSLEQVTIPEAVTVISVGMFQDCAALKTVNMSADVKMISNRAFQGCKAMTEFVVPANVTMIGDQAFAQCEALKQVTIPAKTTSIGSGAFSGTTVTVLCHNGSQAAVYAANNGLTLERTYTVSFYTNSSYSNVISSQEVVEGKDAVPPQVEERAGYRMSWSGDYTAIRQDTRVYQVWKKLFAVTFVDNFNGRTEVVQVDEGGVATPPEWTMNGYSLSWDTDLNDEIYSDTTIHAVWQNDSTGDVIDTDIVKPKKKGKELTKGNYIYKVTSAKAENPTVKFTGLVNAQVSTVKIPETVSIGGVRYTVTAVSANAANGNSTISSVIINKNVTSISAKAFYNCTNLKKVKLKSKSITKINKRAFSNIHAKVKFYTYNSQIGKYRIMLRNSGVKKPRVKRL